MDNQRNLILAIVLSAVLLFGFDFLMGKLYPQPETDGQPVAAAPLHDSAPAASDAPPPTHVRDGGLTSPADIEAERASLALDLGAPERIRIEAPALTGSINPVGARIDDLTLNEHKQTIDEDSGPVRLFSPDGTPAQHFAQLGWVGEGVRLPHAATRWDASGGPLTPGSPVTLSWDNGEGQIFTITLSVDENYMLTAEQAVRNNGAAPVVVQPYGFLNRTSRTASSDTWNVHSGPIGAFDGSVDFGNDYDDVIEAGTVAAGGRPDWIGFTDIYWMSALVPESGSRPSGTFRSLGSEHFRADLIYPPVTVAAGGNAVTTTRLFAGAKESEILGAYDDSGITNFDLAIDWGWFSWFVQPILWLLVQLYRFAGNFGVAIVLLTVLVRLVMFPLAQKQFASMAAMRAIQPKMKAIQERYKDDKPKQQQEIMELYKREKVNPLAGCLPIFLQIPIFFALYKALMLSIEMRHKPFVLWLEDLSVPDPLHFLNLFGLLPFDVPSFLAIGPLALLLGLTMWLQFKLNPAAMDPIQQQMFMIMPWVLMFVMAPFPAGLLLYWNTSNLLTIAQQYYLYSKHPELKAQADKDRAEKAQQAEREKAKG